MVKRIFKREGVTLLIIIEGKQNYALCEKHTSRRSSPRRINEIVLGKRSITADTAIRLSLYFETSELFWMGLQDDYDLDEVRRQKGDEIIASVVSFAH